MYQVCCTRYQVSFYLRWIRSVLRYCKVPKYYDQDCRLQARVCLWSSSLRQKLDFECKTITTQSSNLDIPGVPDPPLIITFGKVNFNLMQKTVILFNLIELIMKKYFTRERSILLLASKNELSATKVNDFHCKLLPQKAPS